MEGVFGVELAGTVREDGNSEVQARKQHVERSAGPGPIGGRPELVAGLREEFVRKLYSGDVSEENAMAVERALGFARRAGSVDDEGGILARGINRCKVRG